MTIQQIKEACGHGDDHADKMAAILTDGKESSVDTVDWCVYLLTQIGESGFDKSVADAKARLQNENVFVPF